MNREDEIIEKLNSIKNDLGILSIVLAGIAVGVALIAKHLGLFWWQ